MNYHTSHPIKYLALAVTLAIGLSGCGDRKDEKKGATQVAAKVNGSEISVHQINAVLSKTPGIPPESAGKVRNEILDKLIDQQIAFDHAVEKKLDRNPDVMMALESAKREIVARAYLEQLVSGLPKPTDEEVKNYFANNPNLFSNRRIYSLQELVLEPKADVLEQLRQMVASGKPLEEIAVMLKSKGVNFRGGAATRPAEQIPLEILPRLASLKDGQSTLIEAPNAFTVMRLVASQASPVDEVAARPKIQQFLHNQRAQKAIQEEMAHLKKDAKIEYQGEFAPNAGAAVPAKSVEQEKPADQAKPNAANTIEKGVAGLK
jgi:EpsD family peptidyl-prolyl cis-trans isomerase